MNRIGKYVLEEELGGGGMATLYRARDERGREVAVKLLKRSLVGDRVIVQRFEREVGTLAVLEHPGIVSVLDFGQDGDDHYMVLELLRGQSLQAVMTGRGRLPVERAVAIVDRILDALAACHENDVVHRDVKPSNVMLLEGDRVKLIDFGLAKVGPDVGAKLTETGTVQGTPHYMSPEQCRGEDIGPPSDIYSVGALTYEMLAGKSPFAGSDAATLMAAHLFVDPPPLEGVPLGIATLVRSMLAKRPEDRPTARAVRAALADALQGTDDATRRAAGTESRVETMARPREERSIGGGEASPNDVRGSVIVWMPRGDRSARILGALGTSGIDAKLAEGDDVPPVLGPEVLVCAGFDRLRLVREADRKRAVVVVDVGGPDETTQVIRLGGDDMLLRGAPDGDLVAKVKRLLRRRR